MIGNTGGISAGFEKILAFYFVFWIEVLMLVAAPFAMSAFRTMRRERQPHNVGVARCIWDEAAGWMKSPRD